MVFKFLEKVKDILTICLLSPAFAFKYIQIIQKCNNITKIFSLIGAIFFELYLNKKVQKPESQKHTQSNPPYCFIALPTAMAPFIFFLKLRYPYNWWIGENETQWEMIICQWHKITVYAYPGIVNICFIGKNTFHLCENILNLLWNFASKNKTKMQFDMLRVTFSISNYTLHYLTFAENII